MTEVILTWFPTPVKNRSFAPDCPRMTPAGVGVREHGPMATRPRGRPRAEPIEVQRRRIIDAARRQLDERDYDDLTVAGVAQAAAVPRAVVYDLIGDKASVFAAVADEVAAEVVAAMEAHLAARVDDGASVDETIRREVHWFFELLRADRSIGVILSLSGRLGGGAAAVETAHRRIEDALTVFHVDLARRFDVARGQSARLLSAMVLSAVEAVVVRPAVGESWPLEETAALVAEFIVGGYLRTEGDALDATEAFDRSVGGR